jgi:hypothetical protein
VEVINVPIGHAVIVIDTTYNSLAIALSATQHVTAHARVTRGAIDPIVENATRAHDLSIFKDMLDAIAKLAQDKLLGIIPRRHRLVHEL